MLSSQHSPYLNFGKFKIIAGWLSHSSVHPRECSISPEIFHLICMICGVIGLFNTSHSCKLLLFYSNRDLLGIDTVCSLELQSSLCLPFFPPSFSECCEKYEEKRQSCMVVEKLSCGLDPINLSKAHELYSNLLPKSDFFTTTSSPYTYLITIILTSSTSVLILGKMLLVPMCTSNIFV